MDELEEAYRTCPECGGDCEPEPFEMPGAGIRIAFGCPAHGVHIVVGRSRVPNNDRFRA